MFPRVVPAVPESASFHACAPPSARVLDVTVLPVPTAEESKLPVPLQETGRAPRREVGENSVAAVSLKKKGLLLAVMAGVSVAAVVVAGGLAVVAARA